MIQNIVSALILDHSLSIDQNTSIPITKNPFFWITIISVFISFVLAVVNIALYCINRRTLSLMYETPKLDVLEKTKVEDSTGEYCQIHIVIKNPSSYKNKVFVELKSKKKSLFYLDKSKYIDIPANEIIDDFYMKMKYEKIEKYLNKDIFAICYDLRNKKTITKFPLTIEKP